MCHGMDTAPGAMYRKTALTQKHFYRPSGSSYTIATTRSPALRPQDDPDRFIAA
jgi:hypothetical protein